MSEESRWSPTISNMQEKLSCIFATVAVPGIGNRMKFPQSGFIYELAKNAKYAVSGAGDAAKRNYGNWRQAGRLPRQIAEYIVALTPGLTMEMLATGSLEQIRTHMRSLAASPWRPHPDELQHVETQYRKNRPDLQSWCMRYYDSIQEPQRSSRALFPFPLVARPHCISDRPFRLTRKSERTILAPLLDDRYDDGAFEPNGVASLLASSGHATYVDFRNAYSRDALNKDRRPFSGFSYRLMKIEPQEDLPPRLHFAKSRYFGYINTGEARAFDAAFHHWHLEAQPDAMSTSQTGLRQSPASIDILDNRNAIAGINAITLVRDSNTGTAFYYRHLRENVDEAIGTNHVVPAGTFQPNTTAQDTDWDSVDFDGEFSLLDTIRREFMEEVLARQKQIAAAKNEGRDWRQDGSLGSIYQKILEAEGADIMRVWFLGMGFDPCTEKPELLVAIVVDGDWLGGMKPIWGEEGFGKREPFDPETINKEMLINPSWLSAGAACLWLSIHHSRLLLSQ